PPPPPPPPGQGTPSTAGMPPPPPPPPPPGEDSVEPFEGQVPVRVGGMIRAPMKIVDVKPADPPRGLAAGGEGVVSVEIVIDREGGVGRAHVTQSVPALDQAALDAVRQWKFTQTLLNGAPVPVVVTVKVNFALR